ncbi:hypothetical protein ElyMa_004847500 [Elysia marginata]|uniref:Uncharacterized protein n=1 Tax=Elysia marginata TaxID=1093978 RepID=A0AAV4INW3_9GAST|nr:hypothetical protein ElyMa_004847500 [Elysia marginata]
MKHLTGMSHANARQRMPHRAITGIRHTQFVKSPVSEVSYAPNQVSGSLNTGSGLGWPEIDKNMALQRRSVSRRLISGICPLVRGPCTQIQY